MRLKRDGNSPTIRTVAETAATADLMKANITLHTTTWNTYKCNLKI